MPWNNELAIAYEILSGIPENRFNLDRIVQVSSYRSKTPNPASCGTIGCGIGWLLMHPRYKARGFKLTETAEETLMKSPSRRAQMSPGEYRFIGADMFNIDVDVAQDLFASRDSGNRRFDPPRKEYDQMSDKQILLHRIKTCLYQ
jgi:hypothetical protein